MAKHPKRETRPGSHPEAQHGARSQLFTGAAREPGREENFGRSDDALRRVGKARPRSAGDETAADKAKREEAVDRDRTASRKATEGSRGKRRRGGGLRKEEGSA